MADMISKIEIDGTLYELGSGGTSLSSAIYLMTQASNKVNSATADLDRVAVEAASLRSDVQNLVDAFDGSSARDVETIVNTALPPIVQDKMSTMLPDEVEREVAEQLGSTVVSVENGGTGASTAAGALTNLGIKQLHYRDVESVVSVPIDGGASVTRSWTSAAGITSASKARESFVGVMVKRAWPNSTWTNGSVGAVVSVASVDNDSASNVVVHLTTSVSQAYTVVIRYFFYY